MGLNPIKEIFKREIPNAKAYKLFEGEDEQWVSAAAASSEIVSSGIKIFDITVLSLSILPYFTCYCRNSLIFAQPAGRCDHKIVSLYIRLLLNKH
jgi:hypothetical protein